MEFLEAVGRRRSIRWFRPWQPVERRAIQRILEAARLTGGPGNLQPWRAVVVVASELDPGERDRLLDANNRQRPQELAPVWIYWYADPEAAVAAAFIASVDELLPTGALPPSFGWSAEVVRAMVERGEAAPPGLPALDAAVRGLPIEMSAFVAAQETIGACTVATLAAVNEGLGTCLHSIATPSRQDDVKEVLGVPARFVPVWLQLVGHPAEGAEAGGQRPRGAFEELFCWMRWGDPFERDPAEVVALEQEGLIQPEAPLPWRFAELEALARMFGYVP